MSRMRVCIGSSVLLSNILITSTAGGQAPPVINSRRAIERLQTSQHIAWLTEYTHRAASVLYLSGAGGVTPPSGSTGAVGSVVPGWAPDLRRSEQRTTAAILVKF